MYYFLINGILTQNGFGGKHMKKYLLLLAILGILVPAVQGIVLDIPVRVFDNSGPVPGLTTADFSLSINNKSVPISNLTFHQKQLKPGNHSPARFIILEFHISHYSDPVKEGLTFIFNEILNEDDRLLVVTKDYSLKFLPVADKPRALAVINRILKDQAVWTDGQINAELQEIGKFADKIRKDAKRDVDPKIIMGRGTGVHPHYYMKYFKFSIEKYLDMLLDYKRKFFLPNIYNYHDLAGNLDKTNGDKWLISFYELPVIPRFTGRNRQMIVEWIKELSKREWLDELDYTRKLERLQGDIDDVFDVSKDAEDNTDTIFNEMTRLFYKCGITYHPVFIGPPDRKPGQFSTYPKKDVTIAMAARLAQTARFTGGTFVDAARLQPGMAKLVMHNSSYYHLSCNATPKNIRSIMVKTANKDHRTVYNDAVRSRFFDDILKEKKNLPPSVRLENVTFKNRLLTMTIAGFFFKSRDKNNKKVKGKLNVHIVVLNRENQVVFNQGKGFDAAKKTLSVSLGFKQLDKGDYNIAVQVKDVLTGKSTAYFIKTTI